ncbi:MAG: YihY/virulence factor BrkB family protein [Holosporales bacterium]
MKTYRQYARYFIESALNAGRIFRSKNLDHTAGYLAFCFFLALFPFLFFLFGLAGVIGLGEAATRLITTTSHILPLAAQTAILDIASYIDTKSQSSQLITLATIGTLWAASSSVQALREGIHLAVEEPRPQTYWLRRLLSVGTILAVTLLVISLSVALIVWLSLTEWLSRTVPISTKWLSVGFLPKLVIFLALVMGISVLYIRLTHQPFRLQSVLPGAVLTTLSWFALAAGFSWYLREFASVSVLYGSLGGVIALLLMLYYGAAALLYGAALNHCLQKPAEH